MWQSSPPGSIYDYIRVASFSIGPDGLIEQWSRRAAGLFGMASDEVVGKDPVEAFMPAELRPDAHRRVGEILDGKEWTGLVPFRMPGENGASGLAEIYVMPSLTGDIRPISLRVRPLRYRFHGRTGQQALRHGLRGRGGRPPRTHRGRLP